jgi:drug/metabolite transporter (DMT)-like permease
MNPFIYAFSSILLIAVSQLFFKKGILELRKPPAGSPLIAWVWQITWHIYAGLVLNVVAAFFWLLALSHHEISFIFPFLSLNYLLVPAGAYFFFKERVSKQMILGIAIICAGLLIIASENW